MTVSIPPDGKPAKHDNHQAHKLADLFHRTSFPSTTRPAKSDKLSWRLPDERTAH